MASRQRLFRQGKKEEWKYGNNLPKIICQNKICNHKLRVVDTLLKRMNFADVAITQQQSTRTLGSRKRLSPGMISFASTTFARKKNWPMETNEYFPGRDSLFYHIL